MLDLGRFTAGGEERRAFLADLLSASRDVGFFPLRGHGAPQSEMDGLLEISRQFFALPPEDKHAVDMIHSPHCRGYTPLARELTRGQPDWLEQIDFSVEGEAVVQTPDRPVWSRLQGPNQWPESLPALRRAVTAWQARMTDVATTLLRAFALALGQPEDVFEQTWRGGPNYRTKIAHYLGRDLSGGDQGVGAHKDSGFLTLLLQDEAGGLQIENSGRWIDVAPARGALVVNIGEHLELASKGYLRATMHRAVVPPALKERYSIAFFFSAWLGATIPLLELPADLARHAKGPDSDPQNPMFREVGLNVLKTRLRSHPEIARRYYADIAEAMISPAG